MTKPLDPQDAMQLVGEELGLFFVKLFRLDVSEADYLDNLDLVRNLIETGQVGRNLWWSVTWRPGTKYGNCRYFAEIKTYLRGGDRIIGMALSNSESEALVRALIDHKLRQRQRNTKQWQEKRVERRRYDVFGH